MKLHRDDLLEQLLKSKIIKGAVAVELFLIVGTYCFWRKLNTDRDTRFYFYKSHSWVLDAFYSVGETLSSDYKAREQDLEIWRSLEKSKEN